jgi:VanZ family protein
MKKIILWILVIAWSVMIFAFSAEPAESSDETSGRFGKMIIRVAISLNIIDIPVSADGDAFIYEMAERINHFVRKTAHFTIYLILGVLSILLADCYKERKKAIIYALIFCLCYAISDEIHQLFVPGRSGEIKDVLLDFSGSVLGVLLLTVMNKLKKVLSRKA